jgi:penicillin amidase
MKHRSLIFLVFLFAALLLFALVIDRPGIRVVAQKAAAPAQTTITRQTVAGLRDRVTVRRDARGIPYIEASNEEDLYFAQGYVTASDRLWQMDLLRRTARGELAEIFGRIALEEDKRHRLYGFAPLSEELARRAAPSVRAALEAYARGVNAYLDSLDAAHLPAECRILQYKPRPWRPADSIVVGKLFAETLSDSWRTDMMRASLSDLTPEQREMLLVETSPLDVLLVGTDKTPTQTTEPTMPFQPPRHTAVNAAFFIALSSIAETTQRSLERVGLFAEDRAASNNWVVSGKRTVTGKPLLSNDPHLRPSAPSIWYLSHLTAPGLRVAGVTSPGVPGIILGHNEHIAWGATNLGPDVQDLYLEKFDKDNPRRYLTPAGWREAEVRREEIKVRKSATDPTTDVVPYEVTVTRHGPIIFEKDGARYALRWTALEPDSFEFEAFYALNRARNWSEFRAALSRYPGPTQNFIYADTDGHIGYYGAGRIPIRRTGDGSLPYDGATDAGEWTGYIPFDELPHLYDPPSGIIVTANNRIVGQSYRRHLTHEWAAPYRARRIYNLLTAKQRLSIDDYRAVMGDTYSYADAIFTGEVVKLARPLAAGSPEWRAMLAIFDGWDARASVDSRVMPVAAEMRKAFQQRILTAALGTERAQVYSWANSATFIDRIITTRPRAWLPKEFDSYEALLLACYREARASLAKKLGPDESQWTWGRTGQVRFPHPLASAPLIGARFAIPPLPRNNDGSGRTVNAGAFVSMQFFADPNNWDNSRQGIALGQSGDPASPHWKDQLMDWRNVAPRAFPFTKEAVAAAARETLVLAPQTK